MANDCQREVNGLPILGGCPADTELFLVMNSTASGNNGGYGLRYYKDIKQCILSGLKFIFDQFVIGQPGSPMNQGDSSFQINLPNIVQDSIFITLGGTELPRNDNTQISYSVIYAPLTATILFDAPVVNGQQYIVHYVVTPGTTSGGGGSVIASSGTSIQSGTGIISVFNIPHGLPGVPSYINVTAGSADALSSTFFITVDATNIKVNYAIPPPGGVNNLTFFWYAQL